MASFPATDALEWRGLVEGFYGPPWTPRQRRAQLRFAARHGLNTYVLAPKHDPYHRARWRVPYPAPFLDELAELVDAAGVNGIRLVAALAPGLDWRLGDPDEPVRLEQKARSLTGIGVEHFALLFDDVPQFRPDDRALGTEHGRICARFAARLRAPLLVCPADYAGTHASPYRDGLATLLPPDALITWSGPTVISAAVTADDVTRAEASYGRRIVLWDNVPVNDFDRARTYVGALRGRPAASPLAGLLVNPMVEPAASRITAATAADYAAAPRAYAPDAALRRAIAVEARADAALLRPLADACPWPPDADTGVHLRPLVAAALDGDVDGLRRELRPLAELPDAATGEVGRELEPWLHAGRDMARAASAACALLAGETDDRRSVRRALDQAERHWPNVLRDVLSPFVRTALHNGEDEGGAPYALLVAAPMPTAGEERLIELLRQRGLAVRRSPDPEQEPALVVVSRSAEADAAADAAARPAPLLALFHLERLGLARRSGVLMREERLLITAPEHPLAAGQRGAVTVYRGPAMVRWGEPAREATVVARGVEEPHPVITHYPAGARLVDGSPAPAARAALFLGRDLLAPWVITADGVALVDAAIASLLGAPRPPKTGS